MPKLETAELYAKEKHIGTKRKDGVTSYFNHLEGVVNRLKNLGITNEDVLCAGWLHDTLSDTNATLDDIEQRFGSKVAVLVLSLTQDPNLRKSQREQQYIRQLGASSLEAKVIMVCDISATLREIKNAPWSKTKRSKEIKKISHHLNVIKPELIENKSQIPGIKNIIDGINEIVGQFGQRPIVI